jgi:hypothetical protein
MSLPNTNSLIACLARAPNDCFFSGASQNGLLTKHGVRQQQDQKVDSKY